MEGSETGPLGGGASPIVDKAYAFIGLFKPVELNPVTGLFQATGHILTAGTVLMVVLISQGEDLN